MNFAGHETFHLRDGWLHKGISAVALDPYIFGNQFATDQLGVGKNMVNAIRFWLDATGLTIESRAEAGKKPKTIPSWLGRLVTQYDPYLEEDLTLWLLHSNLANNRQKASSWYWLFNIFSLKIFDSQSFLNHLSRWISLETERAFALTSLQKDFHCIAKTYANSSLRRKRLSPEDSFECPLVPLGLIDYLENSGSYRLNFGKRKVPPAVVAYTILRHLEATNASAPELSFSELLNSPGLPGRLFLLTSDGLLECLDHLEESYGKKAFSFSRTAGLNILRVGKGSSQEVVVAALKGLGNR